jgi:hypothetical protein
MAGRSTRSLRITDRSSFIDELSHPCGADFGTSVRCPHHTAGPHAGTAPPAGRREPFSIFYKFKPVEQLAHLLDVVVNERLYCEHYEALNDPFEGQFARMVGQGAARPQFGTARELDRNLPARICSPCWTVEARIWTSSSASTTETFQACASAAVTETDDLGDTAELNTSALWKRRDTLTGIRVPAGKPNASMQRPAGPNRPVQPFVVNVSRPGVSDRAVSVAFGWRGSRASSRPRTSIPAPSGIHTPFKDSRLWIAEF